jgi:flagellar hook-associated protein 2
MSGGITFGGLSSGLDTGAIIKALIKAERVPIDQLEARKKLEQDKITLIGTFQGLVSGLRDKANALGTFSGFFSYKVTNPNPELAGITATSLESAGAHTLVVEKLNATDRWAFDGVDDPDRDLGVLNGRQIQFDHKGQTYLFAGINQNQTSLNDLAAIINAGPNGGVTASVVQTGVAGSSTAYQLILTAPEGGADDRISNISETISGLTINASGPDANGNATSTNNITVGNYAKFTLDGLAYTRDSNTIADVLPGVSIDLLSVDPATTINFTIGADTEAIKGKLGEFVDAYNEVVKFINDQGKYDEETGPGGKLFGDNMLRRVTQTIQRTLFSQTTTQVGNDPEGFGTLRLLGIESNKDGTLKINDAVMDAKLAEDIDAFSDFFVDTDGFDNGGAAIGTPEYYVDLTADTGVGDDLARALDSLTKSFTTATGSIYKGLFDSRVDALNDKIKRYDKEIEAREYRLDRLEESLVARFAALDKLMGELNAQGAALQNGLAQIAQ